MAHLSSAGICYFEPARHGYAGKIHHKDVGGEGRVAHGKGPADNLAGTLAAPRIGNVRG
jgi:hypothetical protein